MTPQQLREKYHTLETELFLEAARGNVPSYHEFILRFADLDGRFADEAKSIHSEDDSLDIDVTIKYEIAEDDGVPLREYAYRWLTENADIQLDIPAPYSDEEDDDDDDDDDDDE